MRFLLVEDDEDTARYVTKGLGERGHVVDRVADGRSGLFQAGEVAYDALVVDRMLPGLDGLSLVRVLVWLMAAVACALLAVAFAVTALVVALWDTHRTLGLIGGTLAFLALAGVCAAFGARTLRRQPGVLEGSLQQLREDRRGVGSEP